MEVRKIRHALLDGRPVFATMASAQSPRWPEIVRQANVDFVFVDTEHIPLGREMLSWMCQTYAALGVPPVVRIPCPNAFEALKVLDGGAQGVIGPYIESAEQVRELAGAVRWRPLKGRRLEEALDDPESLEPELREYLEARNRDTLLIVNIESAAAIENLDEILAVPGLDAVLIGPHDLSCNLGIPEQYFEPRFDKAVRTVLRKAREHHVGAGVHFWEGIDQEIIWSRAGANLIMHSTDITIYAQALKSDMQELRGALELTESRDEQRAALASVE